MSVILLRRCIILVCGALNMCEALTTRLRTIGEKSEGIYKILLIDHLITSNYRKV